MVTYDSEGVYIASCKTVRAKIVAIDAIIDALMLTAAKSASNDNITQYSLNDGQTIINTMYRGTKAIFESIKSFETLKQMYTERLNGRVVRLVDSKNFTGGWNNGGR
jgi:hypothetical protein